MPSSQAAALSVLIVYHVLADCASLQSENSQLETKLSGIPVSSGGKRDSLLGKAATLKDKSSTKTSKPVSVSLNSN